MPTWASVANSGLPQQSQVQSWAQAAPPVATWGTEAGWSAGLASLMPNCKFPSLGRLMLNFSHTQALRHALTEDADIMINAIDLEWHDRERGELTEIGIAVLDSRDIKNVEPGTNGENWMKQVWYYHLRIKEAGHLQFSKGNPEKFQWGTTVWVTMEQAKAILTDCFNWPAEDIQDPRPRPIVFLGHALHNDIRKLKEKMGLDLDQFGTIVKKVDTQIMAKNVGIGPRRRQVIGLATLCNELGISPSELHNCGNDIAFTMICALLMAKHNGREVASQYENEMAMAKLTVDVKAAALSNPQVDWDVGVHIYCTRCSQDGHLMVNCKEQVKCDKCIAAGDYYKAFGHQTDRCKSQFFREREAKNHLRGN